MSNIATDITRILTAKADIKAAIESKGVEVGDGLIDTYADKILKIPTGSIDNYRAIFGESIQNKGTRTDYQHAFSYWRNLKATVRPMYDIKPTTASYMFYSTNGNVDETISLPELSNELGIVFDFSQCQYLEYAFSYAQVSDTGYIDLRNSYRKTIATIFLGSQRVLTTHLRLADDGSIDINGSFNYCYGIENITIEGLISKSLDIKWSSNLTADSMKNIISCLADYSDDEENAFKYTVSFASGCWARLEADSTAPDGNTWKDYVQTLGWNV